MQDRVEESGFETIIVQFYLDSTTFPLLSERNFSRLARHSQDYYNIITINHGQKEQFCIKSLLLCYQ